MCRKCSHFELRHTCTSRLLQTTVLLELWALRESLGLAWVMMCFTDIVTYNKNEFYLPRLVFHDIVLGMHSFCILISQMSQLIRWWWLWVNEEERDR